MWQIPIFARGDPRLSSATMSLTSVFGMGTGVTSSISSPRLLVYSYNPFLSTKILFFLENFNNMLKALIYKQFKDSCNSSHSVIFCSNKSFFSLI